MVKRLRLLKRKRKRKSHLQRLRQSARSASSLKRKNAPNSREPLLPNWLGKRRKRQLLQPLKKKRRNKLLKTPPT